MPDPTIAFEQDLNNIVFEYLEFANYSSTTTCLKEECARKSRPIPQSSNIKSDARKQEIQRDLLQLFHSGDRREFFMLWSESLPQVTRDKDQLCQKLEFYLQIYFAIYFLRNPQGDQKKVEDSMAAFKTFLETRGNVLSQTTEFLPYYALPFVPNPTHHPSFRELFADSWVPDLQLRLEKFLAITLKTNSNPRLLELYKDGSKDIQLQLNQCQQMVVESERRTTKYMKRYSKLQSDYHNIISITAELVDTLEATFNGTMVSPEYLQSVCARLFSNQNGQSMDFTRPGTAGSAIRRSLVAPINQNSPRKPETAVTAVPVEPPPVVMYPSLDYTKVKEDVTYAEDRQRCLLLQALRWRLTKSVPGEQRDEVVTSYVSNDLLGCRSEDDNTYREAVFRILKEGNLSAQYAARLFNGMASLRAGRAYLSENNQLMAEMIEVMRAEGKDSITREMLLGTLQKLSLKRALQSSMIRSGMIEWLVEELLDMDALSDYSLEYSVALLMNLCLRTTGKLKCAGFARKILGVLSDLLGHDNHDIRPYINGTLYSILCVPEVKTEAVSMGLEDIMRQYKSPNNPEMNRQIDFIIRQLNSDEKPKDPNDSDDEGDEEEDEEEADAMEADLDKDEEVRAGPTEDYGEKLLASKYLAVLGGVPQRTPRSRPAASDEPLMRPTTPGRLPHKMSVAASVDNQSQRNLPASSAMRPISGYSRPPTSSGRGGGLVEPMLREQSSESAKTDLDASEMLGRTLGNDVKVVKSARIQSGVSPSKTASQNLGENIDYNEYSMVFGSRPKIVRTPEVSARRGTTAPITPAPKVSSSNPKWSHRPTSGLSVAQSSKTTGL